MQHFPEKTHRLQEEEIMSQCGTRINALAVSLAELLTKDRTVTEIRETLALIDALRVSVGTILNCKLLETTSSGSASSK